VEFKTWRKHIMHLRNTLKSFGQAATPTPRELTSPIRCVTLPVQAKVPVDEAMQTKMDAAKSWLGDRYLLHSNNRIVR